MAKILLVEDNIEQAELLLTWLERENHVIDMAHTGEDALQLLSSFGYDLLVLDWELPGIEGIKVCEKYRKTGGSAPILFLTGRGDISSKQLGLDTGADDYLTKPYDFRELAARIRAMLRRPPSYLPSVLQVPGLALEVESRTAIIGSERIMLSHREFSLLEYLMRHPNRTFSSKALLDGVWPAESAFSEDTVRSCMRSLRKKITIGDKDCVIKTIQGSGYLIENKD